MKGIGFLIVILIVPFVAVHGKGNTLHAGETLHTNELLNSSNGRFQLGFFNITNTKKQYLGIWYTDPKKTILWVANGDHPIISGTGILSLYQDGTLFLRDSGGQDMWSTGSQHSIGEPQACLLDSGLLVVNDTKTGKLLWQSLYQLSDTLLPYVPLGYTKLLDSVLEIQLTSWNTTGTDPSPGQYVRKLDPSRQYELVTFKGSEVFYRTGPWNGTGWNGFHIMTQEMVRFFVSKSGNNGAFFWYEPLDPSILWQQVLKDDGITYRNYFNGSDWNGYWKAPLDSTAPYAKCGPYGIFLDDNCKCCVDGLFHPKNEVDWMNRIFSEGCERSVPLNDPNHGFVTLSNLKLPDTINAISDERKSKTECASWCQKNLSCTAYAYIGWQGCLVWFGDIIDMQQLPEGGDNLYVRVGSKSDSNSVKKIFVPVAVSIAVVVVLLTLFFLRRKTRFTCNSCFVCWPFRTTPPPADGNSSSYDPKDVQGLKFFDFKTIIAATDDFNDTNIIGRGQMGPVYKGVLRSGEEIAVKRLSRSVHNGDEQIKNELSLLTRLKHKNLVKLTGFCIQQQETILCFEFMQNGSLDQWLFGTRQLEEASELNWEQRYKLIQGISLGLLYLHEDNGDAISHRDVKPENILLDKNMVAKISDFGLSRIMMECSFSITSTTGGTSGYIAPEVQTGIVSTKTDVYSFGMVILEIISGKRNNASPIGLVSTALQYLNERRILDFKDAKLLEPCSHMEIKRCIHIALLCLLEEPQKRPNMRLINLWLASQSTTLTPLPAEASNWVNIAIEPSTVIHSSYLM